MTMLLQLGVYFSGFYMHFLLFTKARCDGNFEVRVFHDFRLRKFVSSKAGWSLLSFSNRVSNYCTTLKKFITTFLFKKITGAFKLQPEMGCWL